MSVRAGVNGFGRVVLPTADLTALPDLAHGSSRAGALRSRQAIYANTEERVP